MFDLPRRENGESINQTSLAIRPFATLRNAAELTHDPQSQYLQTSRSVRGLHLRDSRQLEADPDVVLFHALPKDDDGAVREARLYCGQEPSWRSVQLRFFQHLCRFREAERSEER